MSGVREWLCRRTARRAIVGAAPGARPAQSLVELALILPFLFLIIVGITDLGRAFFYDIRLVNAVREGALYGAYAPTPIANVAEQAYAEAGGQLGTTGAGGDFVATVACYNGLTNVTKACNSLLITPGDTIEVVGTYTFRPFSTQIIRIWGSTLIITKRARMPIL